MPTSIPGTGPKWFDGTILHCFVAPTHAMPLPQSRFDVFDDPGLFFFKVFNLPPALTISLSSFLHDGQYLK